MPQNTDNLKFAFNRVFTCSACTRAIVLENDGHVTVKNNVLWSKSTDGVLVVDYAVWVGQNGVCSTKFGDPFIDPIDARVMDCSDGGQSLIRVFSIKFFEVWSQTLTSASTES